VDCPTLSTLAAQYNCLPRQTQLPALIYLATQILENPAGSAPDFINYAGPPLANPPALQNVVIDSNGVLWAFYGNAWNKVQTGGGGAPDYIDYPGPPITDPPLLANIVVDSTGVQWQFWNNQWQ